jgi:hypothetical protein
MKTLQEALSGGTCWCHYEKPRYSTAGESTITAFNIGDVTLNDATTTSAKFAKVKNPYKKQAAVIPTLFSFTVTSDVAALHAATTVTASSVTPSNLSVTSVLDTTGMFYYDTSSVLSIITPSVTYVYFYLITYHTSIFSIFQ